MKVASIYIDKDYIAKKLGIETNQFVFGDFEVSSNEIQFKVFMVDDVEANTNMTTNDVADVSIIRRQHIRDFSS